MYTSKERKPMFIRYNSYSLTVLAKVKFKEKQTGMMPRKFSLNLSFCRIFGAACFRTLVVPIM